MAWTVEDNHICFGLVLGIVATAAIGGVIYGVFVAPQIPDNAAEALNLAADHMEAERDANYARVDAVQAALMRIEAAQVERSIK